MSDDHKPEDPSEQDRIMKAGGRVTCDGRVNGGLNLSRALGNCILSPFSLSVSILTAILPCKLNVLNGYNGAKEDGSGGDNRSCKTCKAPVKSLPPTNQHPSFDRSDILPVIQPTP